MPVLENIYHELHDAIIEHMNIDNAKEQLIAFTEHRKMGKGVTGFITEDELFRFYDQNADNILTLLTKEFGRSTEYAMLSILGEAFGIEPDDCISVIEEPEEPHFLKNVMSIVALEIIAKRIYKHDQPFANSQVLEVMIDTHRATA